MPTIKQTKLAKLRLENPDLEKGELVELGGYGPAVIKTPAKALESKGYKEALAEYGLTEELITSALVEDIKSKKGRRFAELGLGADILDMKKSKTNINFNTLVVTQEDKEKVNQALRQLDV